MKLPRKLLSAPKTPVRLFASEVKRPFYPQKSLLAVLVAILLEPMVVQVYFSREVLTEIPLLCRFYSLVPGGAPGGNNTEGGRGSKTPTGKPDSIHC